MAVPLVAALAFLLASFPARNSDLWAHLAAGRLLAGGDLSAATAPPPAPEGGVGQGWLYDLVSFAAYSAFGGAGLVVCKALLVAGLALVLLRLSWAGQGWWWPAVCTTLALLAMSTRLLLQPATVSCLFLALALWFVRPRGETSAGPLPLLPPWPLLVLFAVWANVDGWFLIGLAVVALDGLGQLADRAAAHRGRPDRLPSAFLLSSSPRLLTWLAVLAAVCLLNPSHVHAFSLPAELRWSGPAETSSAWGRIASPFQAAYFETLGRTPAGLAYFPLLGLGLLSFFLNLPRWHWRWSLPWLGLAVLSAFQARAVPFFAVVAGPVLAWNLQELLSRRVPAEVRQQLTWQQGAVVGRVLAVALGLALLACAWPGWLQAPPFEPRRWAVQTAPSLARGGEVARLWHEEGRLGPDACGLHLAPETAHALAWFCPGEKRLLDDALAAAVRGDGAAPADWRERLRAAGVNHVYVYDPDRGRLFEVLNALLANPGEWPLLHREGDLAVFGWRDPAAGQAADPFDGWKMDVGRLAFHPAAEKKAPRRPADREPEPRRWADALWKPAPPRPLDRDEATLHLFHAEALRRSAPGRHQRVWEASQSAAFVGAAWGWTGAGLPLAADLLNARVRAALVRPLEPEDGSGIGTLPIPDQGAHVLRRPFVANRDDTPPALLFLAIRSARRALAANPEDAQACLVLGESYLRLLNSTRERVWAGRLPELAQLRHAQASAALNRAVALRPDLAQAHLSLGGLYREQGYLDLALLHFRNYLDRTRAAGPPPGVSAEAFREQEKQLREELTWMAKDVEARGNRYAKEAG
ncbi:MAG TPA: hypothetical protein VFA26_12640, partial [Gemmataceae bacterium]|nr:hypothetical protein [Gemmataceae bacterium]